MLRVYDFVLRIQCSNCFNGKYIDCHSASKFFNFRVGIRCKTSVAKSKLHNPSYHPLDGTCYLQENFMYFSCVAENSDSHRICPCRNFIKGQTALCVGCL